MNDAMQAGRELDALVAEKVMGLVILAAEDMKAEAQRVWEKQPGCCWFIRGFDFVGGTHEHPILRQRFPLYSTDIAAAWLVVDQMAGRGWKLDVQNRAVGWACLVLVIGRPAIFEHHETAPLSICLAALRAVESPASV